MQYSVYITIVMFYQNNCNIVMFLDNLKEVILFIIYYLLRSIHFIFTKLLLNVLFLIYF